MKNRTVLGILCILLAIAVMFGVSPVVSKMSSGKVTVIQLNKPIAQGKIITADDIVKIEIGSHGVPEPVIRNDKDIIGKYAKSDLYPDVNIIPAMLSENTDNADDILHTLDGNKTAVSVSVPSFAAALSAKLKNGDIVSVIVTSQAGTTIPAELTYVKVITTTTAKGTDQDELQPDEDGNYELPSTITLLANPEQAKLLAGYEANAKMHLALIYRGNGTGAQKFLDAQEKYFTERPVQETGGKADE